MIARIIEASARHRFLVFVAVASALVAAVWCMRRTPLDAIPDLSDPQVIVYTEWTGRSPTQVEDQVTYPIVSALVSAPHVDDVRGFSMFGMSFVYVLFEEGTDVYWARSRVLEYLDGMRGRLPEAARPTLGPDASGVGWAFQYTLIDRSGALGLDGLRALQDFQLRQALGSVPGVAEVASVGGYQTQYQVTVDPERLRAHGVTLDQVAAAIRDSSADVGGRVLEMSGREYYVRGRGYVQRPSDLASIAIRASAGGTPVRVGDVASVRLGPDLRRGLLEWNGDGEAVGAIVVVRHGENARAVIARVKARIEALRPGLPPGVEIAIAYDRSELIDRSIHTLTGALLEEMLVVALVIVGFLLHVRSSLLPILSLPIAVALAFIPMYLLGIPSTIMSLGGIAIAIGATVDAEIVMIEAAHKKLEHAPAGADRQRLLAEAAREVTPAIFSSLLIIAVAFLPVFALTGQAGRLFKPLAYTKTFVMLAAAILSITFAPALRDLLLRGRILPEARHPVSRFITRLYRPFVHVALRRPRSTLLIGALAIASAVPLVGTLGREFMPPLDEGDLLYMPLTAIPGLSIEEARRQLQAQDRVLRQFPEVATVFGKVGRADTATDPAPLTMVETTVRLRPVETWRRVPVARWYAGWAPGWARLALGRWWPETRPMRRDELIAEMDAAMRFPGWTNAWTMPIKTRIDMLTTGVRTPVGIKILGKDLHDIERVGIALEALLARIDGTRSAVYERNLGGLYVDIVPDRDRLGRYGLTVGDVERTIEAAIGGAPVAETIDGRRRLSINLRYPQDERGDLDAVRRVLVATPGGAQVPLGSLADVAITGGPPMVRDEDGMLVGYVYVDLDERRDVGGYVDDARATVAAAIASGALRLPAGTFLAWTGQYEQLAEMAARMKVVVPLTLFLVVVLLYLQFRSVAEVLIVLLSVPFALVGSVWLVWLLDYRLSTAVWVGVIALVGLAAQTGIVMIVYIDHALEQRRRAGALRDLDDIIAAHMEGTVARVRPKLMTVGTMLIGLVPLLWADGSGADVMKRLAAPMVGGLVTSAFLTLELIPVISTYWRQEQLLWERLAVLDGRRLRALQLATTVLATAALAAAALAVAPIYLEAPAWILRVGLAASAVAAIAGGAGYLGLRPAARRAVWP